MILQTERFHCEAPDSGILNGNMEPKVINMRNQRPFEKGQIVNVSHLSEKASSVHSSKIMDALNEQVQSLSDAVIILEQRLSVLEEELRK